MLVLRFKYKGERGWKVPPNIKHRWNTKFRLVWRLLFWSCCATAIVNLFTKSIGDGRGAHFPGIFFVIFTISERVNRKKHALAEQQMKEQFQLLQSDTVERTELGIRPGNVLVTVRDYNTLSHLKWALERIDTEGTGRRGDVRSGQRSLARPPTISHGTDFQRLRADAFHPRRIRRRKFRQSTCRCWSSPRADVWSAIVQTASNLESSAVVIRDSRAR